MKVERSDIVNMIYRLLYGCDVKDVVFWDIDEGKEFIVRVRL